MQDYKKAAAGDPVFALASVDLVETDKPCFHIAQFLPAIRCAVRGFQRPYFAIATALDMASWPSQSQY